MDLQYFPMDSQMCNIEIESYGYSTSDISYTWGKGNKSVGLEKDLSLPQFKVVGHVQLNSTSYLSSGNYSRLICKIQFARSLGFYLIQIYIPASLIVVISWVSFWLHRNATPARVQLGVITVLTITTLMSSTNSQLPKISYVKSIDVFLGTCFVMVFASLLEYAAVGYIGKRISMRKAHAEQVARVQEERRKKLNPPPDPPDPSKTTTYQQQQPISNPNVPTTQSSISSYQAVQQLLLSDPPMMGLDDDLPPPVPPPPMVGIPMTMSSTCPYSPMRQPHAIPAYNKVGGGYTFFPGQGFRPTPSFGAPGQYDRYGPCPVASSMSGGVVSCSSLSRLNHRSQSVQQPRMLENNLNLTQRSMLKSMDSLHTAIPSQTTGMRTHVITQEPKTGYGTPSKPLLKDTAQTPVKRQVLKRYQKTNPVFGAKKPDLNKLFGVGPSDIDKYSRVIFPVCFTCFNLMYWIIYAHISTHVVPELVPLGS